MKKATLALTVLAFAAHSNAAVGPTGKAATQLAISEANAQNVLANTNVNVSENIQHNETIRTKYNDIDPTTQYVNEVEANLVEAKMIGTDYLNVAQIGALHTATKTLKAEIVNGNQASLGSLTMRSGKITDLAVGEADADAVNVSQLKASVRAGVEQANAYTDTKVQAVQTQVTNLAGDVEGNKTAIAGNYAAIKALEADQIRQDQATAKAKAQADTALARANANGRAIRQVNASVTQNTQAIANVNGRVDDLRKQFGKEKRKLRAGIAGANALAMLPQSTKSGSSTLGVSVGGYSDANAFAVGYSRLSDNGKHIIKAGVNYDFHRMGYGASYGFNF